MREVTLPATSRDDWDQHWNEYAQGAADNPAQAYRRDLIFSLLGIRGSGEGARILDIGSGQGDMAAAIRARFPQAAILGLELSNVGVEIATRKVSDARFVQCNLLTAGHPPPDQQGWATHAICSEVIEHVDDPAELLKKAHPYMAPDCCLVVTAPGGPMSAFDKHIGHRKHWRPEEIAALLSASGYTPEHASGAGFPFFNLYRCLVILRGKRLIADVSAETTAQLSFMARAAMAIFHKLMRMHLNSSRRGWQMVGKARAYTPRIV